MRIDHNAENLRAVIERIKTNKKAPFLCHCHPWPFGGWLDPVSKSMQPACITDAHFRARELGEMMRANCDEETRAKFFRALRILLCTVGARSGTPALPGVRQCSFQFVEKLCIALSTDPNSSSIPRDDGRVEIHGDKELGK